MLFVSGTPSPTYWSLVLEATPRLLGTMDRESLSPTWGSFDRDHWAWKFRDFPITMLQTGVLPLAWLWSTPLPGNAWSGNGQLLKWIIGAVQVVLDRQHRHGGFDTVAPNAQDHGVTLAQCYLLATTARLLGDDCPAPLAARLSDALQRGTNFAVRSEEDYAFISNHHALFALAWLRVGTYLGDASLCTRADDAIATIIEKQSPDGWYAEYGGPDPGYESLGLHYLAQFERERPSAMLSQSIDRSLEFLAHCVQPDGGLGGGFGSRHTIQWFPAAFELLAGRSVVASSIAEFMRSRLGEGQVVTPRTVDAHNLAPLLHSYCLAHAAQREVAAEKTTALLPCQQVAPLRYFADAGLVVASTPRYFALCGLKKGGVLSAFDKPTTSIVYEDAGYVAEYGGNRARRWSSAVLGLTVEAESAGAEVHSESRFGLVPRPVLTPGKFLLLRFLNLTLFHSVTFAALVRRMIIASLITGRRVGRLSHHRRLTFHDDRIVVHDRISGGDRGISSLWRPRTFTAVHMGSARYFHPRDLVELPEPRLADATRQLATVGWVELGFTVPFGDGDHTAVVDSRGSSL